MKKFIFKRIMHLIPILFGITFLCFALLYMAPGDPALKKLTGQGIVVSEDVLIKTRHEMGLDKPLINQYGIWLVNILKGDMGTSFRDGIAVSHKLSKGMGYTFILAISTLIISIIISIPLGILSAVKKNKLLDYLIRFSCFAGNAVPNFLLAILLIYFFCIRIKIFPVVAKSNIQGLFLPSLSLAIPLSSVLIRQVRASVLEQMGATYVKALYSRGVSSKYILFRNVLRNSMSSIITVLGLSIGTLLGGSVVVETIFMWPGIGKLVMDSITARDYPVIQGFVIITSIIYISINLLVDISYSLLDSRVKE